MSFAVRRTANAGPQRPRGAKACATLPSSRAETDGARLTSEAGYAGVNRRNGNADFTGAERALGGEGAASTDNTERAD